MVKINLTKTQKTALAVLVAAIVAVAALFVALPMLEPDAPDYAAVVDVKIHGPGWTIIAEDVGVDNASALNALKAAGEREGFTVVTDVYVGFGEFVTTINGTEGNTTHYWLYGVNGAAATVGADAYAVVDGDVVTFWFTDDYMSQPPAV
jgi:hypothetical protein